MCVVFCSASVAHSQGRNDAKLELLGRIRQHLNPSVAGLPKYTCLETMERRIYSPAGKLEFFERLRLQVLVADGKELFSWPNSSGFTAATLDDWVSAGAITTGNFAATVQNVFAVSGVAISYHSPEHKNGRALHRFDFHAPSLSSSHVVTANGRSVRTGYSGSFWAEDGSLDVVRMQWSADNIPPDLGCRLARNEVSFGRVKLGEANRLIPSTAELVIVDGDGREARNTITFSACQRFGSESSISFTSDTPAVTSARAAREARLPAGIPLTIRTEQPISSVESAAGDPVSGRLDTAVSTGKITLPKGTRIIGRLRRLEHHFRPSSSFLIGMEFFAAETPNGLVNFAAHLTGPRSTPDVQILGGRMLRIQRGAAGLDIEDEGATTGVGLFRMHEKTLNLPTGFRTRWETH